MTQAARVSRPRARPMVIGHRGARGALPENTMAGLKYLMNLGVRAVEIDVQNAADQVPVVIHDPYLSPAKFRDANGAHLSEPGPKVVNTSVADLKSYNAGQLDSLSAYGQRFPDQSSVPGEAIPTFAEACAFLTTIEGLFLNVEVKSFAEHNDLGDAPGVLASSVLQVIEEFGLADRVLISSFDWRVLGAVRELNPGIDIGYLTYLMRREPTMVPNVYEGSAWMDGMWLNGPSDSLPALIARQGAVAWNPYYEDVTPALVEEAHAHGLCVNAWTVNGCEDIKAMIDARVDGIVSDYPERVLEVLETLLD